MTITGKIGTTGKYTIEGNFSEEELKVLMEEIEEINDFELNLEMASKEATEEEFINEFSEKNADKIVEMEKHMLKYYEENPEKQTDDFYKKLLEKTSKF